MQLAVDHDSVADEATRSTLAWPVPIWSTSCSSLSDFLPPRPGDRSPRRGIPDCAKLARFQSCRGSVGTTRRARAPCAGGRNGPPPAKCRCRRRRPTLAERVVRQVPHRTPIDRCRGRTAGCRFPARFPWPGADARSFSTAGCRGCAQRKRYVALKCRHAKRVALGGRQRDCRRESHDKKTDTDDWVTHENLFACFLNARRVLLPAGPYSLPSSCRIAVFSTASDSGTTAEARGS